MDWSEATLPLSHNTLLLERASQMQPQGCDKQSGEYHADRFPIASSGAAEVHRSQAV